MHFQSNQNQLAMNQAICSDLALQIKVYKVFLEMRELLEGYAPLWYSETLHNKAEKIVREYGARAKSRSEKIDSGRQRAYPRHNAPVILGRCSR
jgi:hypothetical protein